MSTDTRWGCYFDTDRNVHVAPLGDLLDHELTDDCACGVATELVADKNGVDCWLYTHDSLDGREHGER